MLKPCNMLSTTVREISKPKHVQINLLAGFSWQAKLYVVYHDGSSDNLTISTKVAEVLIASGIGYLKNQQ